MRKRTSSSRRVARLIKPAPRQAKTQGSKVGNVGRFFRRVGALGGAIASGYTGMPGLTRTGRKWGGNVSKFLGYGSYDQVTGTEEPGRPMMSNFIKNESQEGVFRYSSKEFLGEVRGSTVFTKQKSFRMNPGDPATFPWLHTVARKFERYRFVSLMFHFQSSASQSNSSVEIGDILGCHIDNPALLSPSSRQAVEIKSFSRSGTISRNLNMPIECDGRYINKEWDYVRPDEVSNYTNADLTDYDHGRYEVFTVGVPNGDTVIGSLILSFEIEFAGQTNEVASKSNVEAQNPIFASWRNATDSTVQGNTKDDTIMIPTSYDAVYAPTTYANIARINLPTEVEISTGIYQTRVLPYIQMNRIKGFFRCEIDFQLAVNLETTALANATDAWVRWSGPTIAKTSSSSSAVLFNMNGNTMWRGDDFYGSSGHWPHTRRVGHSFSTNSDTAQNTSTLHFDFWFYLDGTENALICLGQFALGAKVTSTGNAYYARINSCPNKMLRVTQVPEHTVRNRTAPYNMPTIQEYKAFFEPDATPPLYQ